MRKKEKNEKNSINFEEEKKNQKSQKKKKTEKNGQKSEKKKFFFSNSLLSLPLTSKPKLFQFASESTYGMY